MRPRVVVVGGGFGGLRAVRGLRGAPVDVLLIDRRNYHLFTPLLYQVASALLDPSEIAYPLRALIRRQRNADLLLAEVQGVDLAARRVQTSAGDREYDYLVLAPGSITNFFGIPGLEAQAQPLKELGEALALRNHVLARFEAARWEPDAGRRRLLHTFAVVGGGPTGIEYAGALRELIHVLRRDFPKGSLDDVRVILLEASDRLLGAFSPKLAEDALRSLRKKGVEVRLGAAVETVEPGELHLHGGDTIAAGSVVWTAGVEASPIGFGLGRPARQRQVVVEPTLQLPGHPEVLIAGDLAAVEGEPLPMLAPVAMQQGDHAARAIRCLVAGVPVRPFRYTDRGIMATIGRSSAVVELRRFHFTGLAGWVVWLFLHLMLLVGFRNRLVALVNWAWDYLLYDRPIRLIVSATPAAPETGGREIESRLQPR